MKTWKDLLLEKRDELFDLCKEAEYEALTNHIQGWDFAVILDCDGTVEVVGPRNNSQSEREWRGLARQVWSSTYDGTWTDEQGDDNPMAWFDESDDDFAAWRKAHETDMESGSTFGWVWEDGEIVERAFDDCLSDELYDKAAFRHVYFNDQMDDAINGCLDSLAKDWEDDELPNE